MTDRFILIALRLLFILLLFAPCFSQAAIAFRSKSFISHASSTSSTPTEPAGTVQNDILFMWVVINSSPTITPPTGWTELYALSAPNSIQYRLYWIRRGSSAPSYTISWSTSQYNEISVTAWSGVATSGNPYDVTANNTPMSRNPSNPNCPSVTTTVANTVVIAFGVSWGGWSTTAGAPTGYSIAEGGVNGDHNDIGVAYIVKAAIGAEDPPAFTGTQGTADQVAEVTVALKPALLGRVQHRTIHY